MIFLRIIYCILSWVMFFVRINNGSRNNNKGLSTKNSALGGFVQFGHFADKGGVVQMLRTSTLFAARLRIFRTIWCVRSDKWRKSQFCADVFYGRPLINQFLIQFEYLGSNHPIRPSIAKKHVFEPITTVHNEFDVIAYALGSMCCLIIVDWSFG